MRKFIIYYIILLFGLTACFSSQKVINSWVSPEISSGVTYEKVFVAALTDDLDAKNFVENAVSEKLKEMGISVVKSVDMYPPNFSAYDELVREEKLQKIRETGSDAIFALTLLDVVTEERYHPGTPYTIESEQLLFYRHYLPYYKQRYSAVYSPDYYTSEKTYFIESNLYDVSSEKMVWTVQSSAFNPLDLSAWFKGYSKLMIEQLRKDGLIAL